MDVVGRCVRVCDAAKAVLESLLYSFIGIINNYMLIVVFVSVGGSVCAHEYRQYT